MPAPHTRTTAERGYGAEHQAERERLRPRVEAGLCDCVRCGGWIEPGTPWDLGHNDDRTAWTGPEHQTCNRSAGGRNGARATNGQRTQGRHTSRQW